MGEGGRNFCDSLWDGSFIFGNGWFLSFLEGGWLLMTLLQAERQKKSWGNGINLPEKVCWYRAVLSQQQSRLTYIRFLQYHPQPIALLFYDSRLYFIFGREEGSLWGVMYSLQTPHIHTHALKSFNLRSKEDPQGENTSSPAKTSLVISFSCINALLSYPMQCLQWSCRGRLQYEFIAKI